MPGITVEPAVRRKPELNAPFGGHSRLAEEECAKHWVANALQQGLGELLGDGGGLGGQLNRLLLATELDQAGNRMEPVGKVVGLGA